MAASGDNYNIEVNAQRIFAHWNERWIPTPFWYVSGQVDGNDVARSIVISKWWAVNRAAREVVTLTSARVMELMAEEMLKED